uniref:Vasculin n=1 Tax=Leptobrachium leishanense TaxID=445787 RepID=A0A8C5MHT5_9ANUR
MAQHDFAPAWLNFPTPPSSKYSLDVDKPSECPGLQDGRYGAVRRRHSPDMFDSSLGFSSGVNLGKKENHGWRSQSVGGPENINPRLAFGGAISRASSSTTFHVGKSLSEGSTSETDRWKDEREKRRQIRADFSEYFPSLYQQTDVELAQVQPFSAGIWDYPLGTTSRTSPVLGMKDFTLSGYQMASSTFIQPSKNWPETLSSLNPSNESPQPSENYPSLENLNRVVSADSVRDNFGLNMSMFDDILAKQHSPVKEVASVSELHDQLDDRLDSSHVEDKDEFFDLNDEPSSSSVHVPSKGSEGGNLSSSLEEEYKLLKAMGWDEDDDSDLYAPLTEEELQEFHCICQQHGIQKKSCLSLDPELISWNPDSSTTENGKEAAAAATTTMNSDAPDDDA